MNHEAFLNGLKELVTFYCNLTVMSLEYLEPLQFIFFLKITIYFINF